MFYQDDKAINDGIVTKKVAGFRVLGGLVIQLELPAVKAQFLPLQTPPSQKNCRAQVFPLKQPAPQPPAKSVVIGHKRSLWRTCHCLRLQGVLALYIRPPNKPVFYFLTGLDLAYCVGEETFYRGSETYHVCPFLLRD